MGGAHHCSGLPISEMTYTVSSGTLKSTIPFQLPAYLIRSRKQPPVRSNHTWPTVAEVGLKTLNTGVTLLALCPSKFYSDRKLPNPTRTPKQTLAQWHGYRSLVWRVTCPNGHFCPKCSSADSEIWRL